MKEKAYLLIEHHLNINFIVMKVLFYYVIIVVELVRKVSKTVTIEMGGFRRESV